MFRNPCATPGRVLPPAATTTATSSTREDDGEEEATSASMLRNGKEDEEAREKEDDQSDDDEAEDDVAVVAIESLDSVLRKRMREAEENGEVVDLSSDTEEADPSRPPPPKKKITFDEKGHEIVWVDEDEIEDEGGDENTEIAVVETTASPQNKAKASPQNKAKATNHALSHKCPICGNSSHQQGICQACSDAFDADTDSSVNDDQGKLKEPDEESAPTFRSCATCSEFMGRSDTRFCASCSKSFTETSPGRRERRTSHTQSNTLDVWDVEELPNRTELCVNLVPITSFRRRRMKTPLHR